MRNRIAFGHPPRTWQRECAVRAAGRRFVVLVLHRRAGKTEIALQKLLDAAVKNRLELPFYAYVAPLLKQAKIIAWSRLKQMVAPLVQYGAVEINESDTFVRFPANGAIIRIFGADDPDRLRGVRLDGAIIDEVAQIKPDVWEEVIQPALADRLGWAWFIGTPKGVNLFSKLYFEAQNDPLWFTARYTVYDTEALDPVEIERLRATMSEATFAREFLCDFSAAGDDQLVSLTEAEDAARRSYKPGEVDHAARVIGIDPARFGSDRSVLIRRQGLVAFAPKVWHGIDNMQLAGNAAREIEEWRPDAVFIDSGAGAGVIDRLRQLGHDVIEVNFGGKPNDIHFANKRAEMWFGMAEWIKAGGAIPNENALKLELATPTYRYDATNRIVLESKDDIRKRLPESGSPDIADALALTFAHPVMPSPHRALLEAGLPVPRNARDFDPYALAR
ncbi:MAG TPA: terminase family protein [Burkholderiaceae bacterium]|nr:terminase family protein [Burkholderiaceae bacterium]